MTDTKIWNWKDTPGLAEELAKIDRIIERVVLDHPTATRAALRKLSVTALRMNGLDAGDGYINATIRKLLEQGAP
jgi:hypothetical protein